MAIFEALIGGATSLLGGLFGKKKEKTETTIDYVKMAKKAQEAGFNPLTALRNGGSAGFTSTISHPGLSGVADAVGQIGGALGAALDQRYDPIAQKRDRVENALLDYQLQTIQSGPKAPMMFGDVPMRKASPLRVQRSAPMSASGRVSPKAGSNAPGVGTLVGGDDPTVSGMGWNNGKYGMFHAPFMPDAEVAETIYGDNEINSTVYSAAKYVADGAYSAYRNAQTAYDDWQAAVKRAEKRAKPMSAHQADPGSWLDFAPKMGRAPVTTW